MVGHTYTGGDMARAIRSERERCAKIAESVADETSDGDGELYIARKIADAIRGIPPAAPVISSGTRHLPRLRSHPR